MISKLMPSTVAARKLAPPPAAKRSASQKPTAPAVAKPLARPATPAAFTTASPAQTAGKLSTTNVGLSLPTTTATGGPVKQVAAATATAAGGFVSRGGLVTVDIAASDSGYENKIYWSSDNFATRHLLGVDNHQASIALGEFAEGTRIEFGIVNGVNQFFRTGGASSNADGLSHTRSTSSSQGVQIGFEDLHGGGDLDFNDAILLIRESGVGGTPPPTVPAAPLTAAPPVTTPLVSVKNDSRSGLGDGTNPGRGVGTAQSPNMGTLNPNQAGLSGLVSASPKLAAKAVTTKAVAKASSAKSAPPKLVVAAPKSAPALAPMTMAKVDANKQQLALSYVALMPPVASTPTAASIMRPEQMR